MDVLLGSLKKLKLFCLLTLCLKTTEYKLLCDVGLEPTFPDAANTVVLLQLRTLFGVVGQQDCNQLHVGGQLRITDTCRRFEVNGWVYDLEQKLGS